MRVVESGSFVAAARSLLIDLAAVGRAITSLEENMGIVLFMLSTRVLKLTTEGKRFYRDGAQMLRKFEETIGRFQVDTAEQRQLKVGMGPALSRRCCYARFRHSRIVTLKLGSSCSTSMTALK